MIQKRYLESLKGCTKLTIPCHPVQKNSIDIVNGVNTSIYTSSFLLTTEDTLYSHIEVNMEQEDFDVSEEFQNYVLSKEEHPYHVVVIFR